MKTRDELWLDFEASERRVRASLESVKLKLRDAMFDYQDTLAIECAKFGVSGRVADCRNFVTDEAELAADKAADVMNAIMRQIDKGG